MHTINLICQLLLLHTQITKYILDMVARGLTILPEMLKTRKMNMDFVGMLYGTGGCMTEQEADTTGLPGCYSSPYSQEGQSPL